MMTSSQQQPWRKWLELDAGAYQMPEDRKVKGVSFHVTVSPYDLPEAIRGTYDDQRKRFVIEFRYLNEETTEPHRVAPHIVVCLGKVSRRLHALEVDVDALGAEQIRLLVSEAIDHIPPHGKARVPVSNYAVTKKVLMDKWRELAGDLSPPPRVTTSAH
jgi:hypothetical protein